MRLSFARFKKIGKFRIVNADFRWGIDLFDDLQRLTDSSSFQVVFDIGANVGKMSTLFMRHFPVARIYAFEPVDSTFAKLQHALGHHSRFVLHKLAASDITGQAIMRLFADPAKNTLVAALADTLRTSPTGLEKVDMCRLDGFMSKFEIHSIDLLKIDVEGFEANVLRGCGSSLRPEKIRFIYLEFHRVNTIGKRPPGFVSGHSQLCELDQMLEANGYRLLVIYTQGVHRGEPIGTYNALYGTF